MTVNYTDFCFACSEGWHPKLHDNGQGQTS